MIWILRPRGQTSPRYTPYVLPNAPDEVHEEIRAAFIRGGVDGKRVLGEMLRQGSEQAGDWLEDHGCDASSLPFLVWSIEGQDVVHCRLVTVVRASGPRWAIDCGNGPGSSFLTLAEALAWFRSANRMREEQGTPVYAIDSITDTHGVG